MTFRVARHASAAFALAALFLTAPLLAHADTDFVDSAGRKVALPARIEKVLPAGPPAAADIFMVAPEKLAGWTRAPSPAEGAFMPPAYAALPGIGRLTGRGNTVNLEAVLHAAPNLILDLGSVGPTYASLADRVQEQTGVPYVLIGGKLADTPAILRQLGVVLDAAPAAEALARYAEDTLNLIAERIAKVPQDQRPKIYLARGPRGLETVRGGGINAEALDLVGARNVVAGSGPGNLADVSLEQLLLWQPDVIVTMDENFFHAVWTDPVWQQVPAVQKKRVYLAPRLPFGWIDEPPAANRIIGLRWLAKLLYPGLFPEDLRAETKRFYALFYHQDPSEQQLDALLAVAPPPG